MSDRQTIKRQQLAAKWAAESAPYCLLRYSKRRGYAPIRRKGQIARFGSTHAALVEANRLQTLPSYRDGLVLVDFASAFERRA